MLKIDKTLKTILATLACSLITFIGFAATQLAPDPGDEGPDPPPDSAPIDDFIAPMIIIAIIIGVIYIAKVIKSKQRNC